MGDFRLLYWLRAKKRLCYAFKGKNKMNMSGIEKLNRVFREDVVSLEDFKKRIAEIKKLLPQNENSEFKYFYRGDKFCTPVQSKVFRYGNLKNENTMFQRWQDQCYASEIGVCNCEHKGLLHCLAYMQHYDECGTRLLDFTRDPLVALRFACGKEGEDCRKKVTIYVTESIKIDKKTEIEESLMKLVCSDYEISCGDRNEHMSKDYFIEVDADFPRIKQQDGLFLFMGNREDTFETNPKHNHKVKHELSYNGRGKEYKGYVGVLNISPSAVKEIRKELESKKNYKMDYLMSEQQETESEREECIACYKEKLYEQYDYESIKCCKK